MTLPWHVRSGPIVSLPIGAVLHGRPPGDRRAGPETEPAVGTVAVDMYVFSAELWQYDGPSAWYFVSLPPDIADDIRAEFAAQAAGFGSIKVEAAVRSTQWTTSLFPNKKPREPIYYLSRSPCGWRRTSRRAMWRRTRLRI